MRKIAIIGMSPSAMVAPVADPEWECWGLAWDTARAHKVARVFEIHNPEDWKKYVRQPVDRIPPPLDRSQAYDAHLRSLECPIYMQKRHEDLPQSIPYPVDEIIEACGRDYFGSSIAYMLALAWFENGYSNGIDEVGIWGVELTIVDYHHQRPNLEYWIGRLEQAGVKVSVECPRGLLMRPMSERQQNGVVYKRYGWIVDHELTDRPDPPPRTTPPFDPRQGQTARSNVLRG